MSLSPIKPIRDLGTDGKFVLAIACDITERRRVEEALRENEESFRALAQNTMDLVAVQRADNTLSYVSPSVKRLLGYEQEEMVGRAAADYYIRRIWSGRGRNFTRCSIPRESASPW